MFYIGYPKTPRVAHCLGWECTFVVFFFHFFFSTCWFLGVFVSGFGALSFLLLQSTFVSILKLNKWHGAWLANATIYLHFVCPVEQWRQKSFFFYLPFDIHTRHYSYKNHKSKIKEKKNNVSLRVQC